jgi:TRAP-type C4-dicarboxylate transport system permease small subunit
MIRVLLPASALSILAGIILAITGFVNNTQAVQEGTADSPWPWVATAGVLMVLVPLLAVAAGLVVMFIRDEIRQYPAQKTTMPSLHPMTAEMAASEYERQLIKTLQGVRDDPRP